MSESLSMFKWLLGYIVVHGHGTKIEMITLLSPTVSLSSQRDVGAIKEAILSYSLCLELAPDSRNAGQNRLLALNYIHPGV
jgi:hypothetical protein